MVEEDKHCCHVMNFPNSPWGWSLTLWVLKGF